MKSVPQVTSKITILLLLAVFILAAGPSRAERATPEEMRLACENWLVLHVAEIGPWAGSSDPYIEAVEDLVVDGEILAVIYSIAPDGYVVVPVLKEMAPVKAYSTDSRLDSSQEHGMKDLLRLVMADRAKIFIEWYGSLEAVQPDKAVTLFGPEHRRLWTDFTREKAAFLNSLSTSGLKDTRDVGPLLTTSWHQGTPYNNLCPIGDGGRCVVGCVATASAQIMWYWQWPDAGQDSHTYYWYGDNSCEGSSPGSWLSADFYDAYEYTATSTNLAEINYEVGVAFEMDYGVCGSGIYVSDIPDVIDAFVENFRYQDMIVKVNRPTYSAGAWFAIIQNEIDAGRPLQYFIPGHSIVCDGWRVIGEYNQYHMNYGWGGSHNSWYTVDNLYESDISDEFLLRGIEPDRGVVFEADTTFGPVPFEVNFTGESELTVDTWTWDFGDGDSAYVQSPTHIYEDPGVYDVNLEVSAGGDQVSFLRREYVAVIADTMIASNSEGARGGSAEISVSLCNQIPISMIRLPIEYGGDLGLEFDSFSTAGCRTEYFENRDMNYYDPFNKRLSFQMFSSQQGTSPDLEPGTGPIVIIYFTIESGSAVDTTDIIIDGFSTYQPLLGSDFQEYRPELKNAQVTMSYMCGDVTDDMLVNLLDIVYLINYKYKDGPPPDPMESGDVNSDTLVNLLDIVYLINYKYKGGPEPHCP